MATGRQIRAARMLLEWDAEDLAKHTGLTRETIFNIERNVFNPRPATLDKIIKAFDENGVEFLDNEGLRRKPEDVEIFQGRERFHEFTEFVYQNVLKYGGEVCISASDERFFFKYRKEPEIYRSRMKKLVDSGHVRVRILAEQSNFKSTFAEFRKIPQKNTAPTSFYAFGKCLALISFSHEPAPYVVLLKSGPFTESFISAFNESWDRAEIIGKENEH